MTNKSKWSLWPVSLSWDIGKRGAGTPWNVPRAEQKFPWSWPWRRFSEWGWHRWHIGQLPRPECKCKGKVRKVWSGRDDVGQPKYTYVCPPCLPRCKAYRTQDLFGLTIHLGPLKIAIGNSEWVPADKALGWPGYAGVNHQTKWDLTGAARARRPCHFMLGRKSK